MPDDAASGRAGARPWIVLALILIFVGAAVALAPVLLGFGAGLVVLVGVATFALSKYRDRRAQRRFRAAHAREGRDLLLVYSRSPIWQSYVEATWLPRWGDRAVVLNWSDRRQWDPAAPEVALFRAVAGPYEFNPLAVVVPRAGDLRVVRFWRAFRDFKHGKGAALRAAESAVEQALAASPLDDA